MDTSSDSVSGQENQSDADSSLEFIHHKPCRNQISDLSSSCDEPLTPPPLFERLKFSMPLMHLVKPNLHSSTSSGDDSDKDFDALLDRIKTPLKKTTSTSIRPLEISCDNSRNENIQNIASGKRGKCNSLEKNFRPMRVSPSFKRHITPIRCTPVTLPRKKTTKNIIFNSTDKLFTRISTKEKSCDFDIDKKEKQTITTSFSQHLKPKQEKYSFLESLSAKIPLSDAHPEAVVYRTNFKNNKEKLVNLLFKMYNDTVFNNKLPDNMTIRWNSRMRKTAGFCYYKKSMENRSAKIDLSSKVLDSADRVRDTLIHELCHAASWIIHGYHDGHGSIWKFWATRANQLFTELPPITTCHNYNIATKYVYKCTRCGGCIGRHSKSLDVKKKLCGRCGGTFELLINGKSGSATKASRPLSGFALFVKENYGSVKKTHQGLKHSDVMKQLSLKFNSMSVTNDR